MFRCRNSFCDWIFYVFILHNSVRHHCHCHILALEKAKPEFVCHTVVTDATNYQLRQQQQQFTCANTEFICRERDEYSSFFSLRFQFVLFFARKQFWFRGFCNWINEQIYFDCWQPLIPFDLDTSIRYVHKLFHGILNEPSTNNATERNVTLRHTKSYTIEFSVVLVAVAGWFGRAECTKHIVFVCACFRTHVTRN